MALLRTHHLICSRGGRELFTAVNLRLEAGEALLLQGPNGSGKTSLLRALADLLPYEGKIEKTAPHSYIGHRDAVHGDLTVCDHFHFWRGLAQARRVVFFDDVLHKAGLSGMNDRRASTLSEGQRQRLALCRLLIEDAALWLLDEPSSALDTKGQEFLEKLLADHLAANGAAIIASHSAIKNTTPYVLGEAA
jgi:heme exporter protein A